MFLNYIDIQYTIHSFLFSIFFFLTYFNSRKIAKFFNVELVYDKLDEKAKIEWDQRTVSMVHALLVTPLSIKLWYNSFGNDIFLYMHPLIHITLVISGGYFIWDLYVSFSRPDISGKAMMIHAFAGFFGTNYVNLLHGAPVYKSFCAIMLAYEISTIPLNMKGFIQAVSPKSKLYDWSLMAFAISFLLVRDIWGIYMTTSLLYQLMFRFTEFPMDKNIVLLAECIITMTLNINWGYLLAKKLYQKMVGTSYPHRHHQSSNTYSPSITSKYTELKSTELKSTEYQVERLYKSSTSIKDE